jgi:hypothetical protein
MGLKVEYVGSRSYTEFHYKGRAIGFARGEVQEIPEQAIPTFRSLIEGGSTMWKIVEGDAPADKTEAMKATIETAPVAEEAVEESSVDYASMTRAELMALAKERGLATKNTMKKADLVTLLSA